MRSSCGGVASSREEVLVKASGLGLVAVRCQEQMMASKLDASWANGPERHKSSIGPLLVRNARFWRSGVIASSSSRFGSNASAQASISAGIERPSWGLKRIWDPVKPSPSG
jgi:hypothetical protein